MSSCKEVLNNSLGLSISDAVAHIRRPGSYSLKLPSMAIYSSLQPAVNCYFAGLFEDFAMQNETCSLRIMFLRH